MKLTASQQQLVVKYRKIARDHARRWSQPYRRLLSAEDAESLADYSTCRAALVYDPARANDFWCLLKIAVRTDLFKVVEAEMRRAGVRVSLDALREDGPVVEPAAPTATPEQRADLAQVAAWAAVHPARQAAVQRAAAGASLSEEDWDHLSELRELLGLPPVRALPAAQAARQLRLTVRQIKHLFSKSALAGHKRGPSGAIFVQVPDEPREVEEVEVRCLPRRAMG